MPIAAIIPLIIQLIPIVTTGVSQLIAFVQSLKAAAQQTGEWTPDMEASFRAALLAKGLDPAYLPDPQHVTVLAQANLLTKINELASMANSLAAKPITVLPPVAAPLSPTQPDPKP